MRLHAALSSFGTVMHSALGPLIDVGDATWCHVTLYMSFYRWAEAVARFG